MRDYLRWKILIQSGKIVIKNPRLPQNADLGVCVGGEGYKGGRMTPAAFDVMKSCRGGGPTFHKAGSVSHICEMCQTDPGAMI